MIRDYGIETDYGVRSDYAVIDMQRWCDMGFCHIAIANISQDEISYLTHIASLFKFHKNSQIPKLTNLFWNFSDPKFCGSSNFRPYLAFKIGVIESCDMKLKISYRYRKLAIYRTIPVDMV